jgi:hypothetical protein
MEQQDILLWPDGFWCFKPEYNDDMLRGKPFVLLTAGTPEWEAAKNKRVILRI